MEIVDLSGTDCGDIAIDRLAALPSLEAVGVGRRTTLQGIQQLLSTSTLRCLDLHNVQVNPSVLAQVAGFEHIEYLGLRGTSTSDASLGDLRLFPSLKYVDGCQTYLTSRAVVDLVRACPNLTLVFQPDFGLAGNRSSNRAYVVRLAHGTIVTSVISADHVPSCALRYEGDRRQ